MIDFADLNKIPPGKHHFELTYSSLPDGTPLNMPVTVVGTQPHPRVVVTAGVHGDEYEGVRTVADLIQELESDQLHGTVVLVPVVNPPAFNANTRTSPLDGVNLNRVCPGNADGTISERLVHTLFTKIIVGAEALIDLHSGGTKYLFHPQAGFYRLQGQPALSDQSFAMAQAFGLDLLWELPGRAGVCSFAAMQLGVPAIGLEIGGNGRCEPEHVFLAKRGVQRVLAALHLSEATLEPLPISQKVWRGDFTLAPASGLFSPAVQLNQRVRAGQLLYQTLNLAGKVVYERHASYDGLVSAIRIFGAIQIGDWDVSVLQEVK